MDADALSDDPRDWPTDPFELLGVARSVSEIDLKRAYTRLIRKYKPEHKPDEFRRIREAYEAAIEMSRWYRDAPPRDAVGDLPFAAVPLPPPDPPSAARPRPGPPDRPHETHIDPPSAAGDPVDAAWADAVAGHWGDAYPALVALADQHPHRADLPLRLYWLLALRPALDDDRTRHHWLAAALARARLRGPAVELYRRELDADPRAALSGPYSRLLDLPGATGSDLLGVAAMRLAGATAGWDESPLDRDLTALEPRAADFAESAWLAYLVDLAGRAALDHLGLLSRCRELLAGLRHLEMSHGRTFDRLDEQTMIAERLQEAGVVPEPVRRAVTATLQGGHASRKALDDAIAWAVQDPVAALRGYGAWMSSRKHQDVLNIFVQLVNARRAEPRADYPPALVRGSVRAFVAAQKFGSGTKSGGPKYTRIRPALLRFLLAEQITPEEVVTACFIDPHPGTRALIQHLRDDAPLSLAYLTATTQ